MKDIKRRKQGVKTYFLKPQNRQKTEMAEDTVLELPPALLPLFWLRGVRRRAFASIALVLGQLVSTVVAPGLLLASRQALHLEEGLNFSSSVQLFSWRKGMPGLWLEASKSDPPPSPQTPPQSERCDNRGTRQKSHDNLIWKQEAGYCIEHCK